MSSDITRTPNGRWKARVRVSGRASRRLSKTFDRKADAELWVAEMRRRKQLGEAIEPTAGVQRLDEFIETYWVMHAIPNLEQSTRDNYAHVWEKHIRPRLGSWRVRDITPKVVNRFRAEMVRDGVGANTTRRALVILQSVLTLAVAEEEISDNPVAKIRKPSQTPAREHVPIPVSTIERMREGMEPRDKALLSVLAYAGLRPQEALAVRFEDISERSIRVARKNVDGRILAYTKTRTQRHVRLLEPLVEDLAEWHRASSGANSLLFPRFDAKPFTEVDYRNWRRRRYEPAAERAGLDGSRPYDLRATWVSLMIFEGHTVVEVARQAGHSPETCLRHFARAFEEYDSANRVSATEQIRQARKTLADERRVGRQLGFEL
jgi:integrase